jgi:hypothetical protein
MHACVQRPLFLPREEQVPLCLDWRLETRHPRVVTWKPLRYDGCQGMNMEYATLHNPNRTRTNFNVLKSVVITKIWRSQSILRTGIVADHQGGSPVHADV